MFNDLFLKSEPFYMSHAGGSMTSWDRGVTQERDKYTQIIQVGTIMKLKLNCINFHIFK